MVLKYTYHREPYKYPSDGIFVFGSNLSGIHGAGAALYAKEQLGFKLGLGVGLSGSAYAIPTKGRMEGGKLPVLPLGEIYNHVFDFRIYTHDNPQLKFFVTAIGTGLAGYQHHQIAPLFNNCNINCSFPLEWQLYLEDY